jgi:hypothetical protein
MVSTPFGPHHFQPVKASPHHHTLRQRVHHHPFHHQHHDVLSPRLDVMPSIVNATSVPLFAVDTTTISTSIRHLAVMWSAFFSLMRYPPPTLPSSSSSTPSRLVLLVMAHALPQRYDVVCCGPIFPYATSPPTFSHRFKRVTSC